MKSKRRDYNELPTNLDRFITKYNNKEQCFCLQYGEGITPHYIKNVIIPFLNSNSQITWLNLSNNGIGDPEAKLLARHLEHVKNLCLDDNNIGDEGVIELAKNHNFTTLSLESNKFSIKGIKILAHSFTLMELNLNYNNINDQGMKEFAHNYTLKKLSLVGNRIGDEGVLEFARLNRTMETLDLHGNCVKDAGAIALARNSTLKGLRISENSISDETFKYFARNHTLTSLTIEYNQKALINTNLTGLALNPSLDILFVHTHFNFFLLSHSKMYSKKILQGTTLLDDLKKEDRILEFSNRN